jgi:HPt (histidine-containing phosphotransfer) domain-containing protein
MPALPNEFSADLDSLRAWVGDDLDLLDEIAAEFVVQVPHWIAHLESAVGARDAEGLHRAAHSLKGAVGPFRVPAVRDPAAALEALGATGRLDQAPALLAGLRPALLHLAASIATRPWRSAPASL